MQFLDVVFIGIALSMDACALTVSNCAIYNKTLDKKKEWAMPVAFAVFQGIMPLIGYFLGHLFFEYLQAISDYLVAGVFYLLAIKIVMDIIKEKGCSSSDCRKTFSYKMLFVQAIATSIDALLVGVTMGLSLSFSVALACLTISTVTFVLVTLALILGKYARKLFGKYAEWAGVIILFALATKNLITAII